MQALVTGKLHRDPEKKVSQKGNSYLALVVKQSDESYVRVSLFGDLDAMSMTRKGDSVAIVGDLQTNIWERNGVPAIGMSLIAHRAISAAERKPYKPRPQTEQSPYQFKRFAEVGQAMQQEPKTLNDLGDDLPWSKS
ncbi:single-stranded DNA-binding protein [Flavobacterium sp.]|uniref:single-stranded DNA-binding protein n=1 Tax=Flavobacterium sp. TaxID=239 RepID=UPI0037BEE1C6